MVSKQRVLFQFLFLIFLCVAFTFKISHYLPQYADDGHDKFSLVVTGTGTGTYKYDPKPHEDPHSLDEFQFQFDNAVANFTLPEWMEEFFNSQPIATHNKTLADPKEKFIVLSCHKYQLIDDNYCGGLSDRLRYLPYYLWLAHHTGRKFLIKWSNPHPLEEFLVPPEGGLDWRLPTEYCANEWKTYANRSLNEKNSEMRTIWHKEILKPGWNETRFIFVNANFADIWNSFSELSGSRKENVWPGIFRRMFQPSKDLGRAIDSLAKEFGLVPGEYGGAHIRARYPIAQGDIKMKSTEENDGVNMEDNKTRTIVQKLGDNAIKCVVKAMPKTKHVYVATDTSELIDYLLEESPTWGRGNRVTVVEQKDASSSLVAIVTRPNYHVPSIHIQKRNFPGLKGTAAPKAFFQIFIDLWMLAHTKCLSRGLGGFGHFGSMLSGNLFTCHNFHRDYTLKMLDSCPTRSELCEKVWKAGKCSRLCGECALIPNELKPKKRTLH